MFWVLADGNISMTNSEKLQKQIKTCLFGQTAKQSLSNFEPWKSRKYEQLWRLRHDPSFLLNNKGIWIISTIFSATLLLFCFTVLISHWIAKKFWEKSREQFHQKAEISPKRIQLWKYHLDIFSKTADI